MAVRVPLLLRRLRPALAHFVHSLPLALPCPAVLTVQDLSFERDRSLMGARETAIFRFVVPRSARRARRVLAISQSTKDDLVRLYALAPDKVVVTPLAADPAFAPGGTPRRLSAAVGVDRGAQEPAARCRSCRRNRTPPGRGGPRAGPRARRRATRARRRRARLRLEGRARPADPGGGGAALSRRCTRGSACRSQRRWRAARRSSRRRTRQSGRSEAMQSRTRSRRSSRRRSNACSPTRSRGRAQGSNASRALSWQHTAQITADVYRDVLS